MATEDRIGLGFTFAFDPVAGGTDIVCAIIDPGMSESSSKATAARSLLGDTHDTFLGGSVDPGELTFTIAFNTVSATMTALYAWYNATGLVAVRDCTIGWPAISGGDPAGTSTGKGILTAINRVINRNELVTCEITIKKSGEWVDANAA